ncbi:G-protein coupled bile acid receptor 1 [Clupea harengus]|uniref:G-protein coupled bile acid receptor 1 n=1 Tax=Clupea harengus TaxID=7950 RepID=A0A6P8GID5_CLUHA|nr:G-protein coupled bile acid receptor 1 [Clupea harengus]XP_031435214.1 G-protein coupled bile acid receptor 1 [Clupea harengus]
MRRLAMDSDDDHLQEKEWLISCITIPLSSAIILANLVIIVGIVCNRQLHNTPNYFFLSLLVADLCTGIALPFIPRMGLEQSLDFQTCLLVHTFPNFLFLSYLFNLVMVHYERYLCIVSPLHYNQFWVHRCFPVALLAVWVPPLLYASLPAFGWNEWNNDTANSTLNHTAGAAGCAADPLADDEVCSYKKVFPMSYIYLEVYGILLPAIVLIAGMTGRVLWITRKQMKVICKLHRAVERYQTSDSEHRLNLRYAKCLAAVSLIFLLCWVPYITYVNVALGWLKGNGKSQNCTLHIILSCTGIGSMAIIPIILGLANRQYTDPARKVLLKMRDCWRGMRGCTDMSHSN